jgi:hypothetical protein
MKCFALLILNTMHTDTFRRHMLLSVGVLLIAADFVDIGRRALGVLAILSHSEALGGSQQEREPDG